MLLHANKTKKDWIQFLKKHDISQIKTNTMIYIQTQWLKSDQAFRYDKLICGNQDPILS